MDPQFIDVDFTKQPQYVFGDLGMKCFAAQPTYEDSVPLVPRDKWQAEAERIEAEKSGLEWLVTRIYDQDGEGSCVANQTAQGNEVLQAKQFGKENVVHVSAISLYKRIGRSPNSGAMVDDGMEEMQKRGILPLDTPENRTRFGDAVMPNIGFYKAYPANWEETAKLFKVAEASPVTTFDGLCSALLNGHPCGVGRQGHSILYVGLKYKNGKFYALYPNSWGHWGSGAGDFDYGFGMDSESQIKMSASWAVAWRSLVIPSR